MTELRPFNLCKWDIKLFLNVLCHRLKVLLLKLILEIQFVFMSERLYSDNILIS